jgi:TRAP-type C4-dicarboxylate transport system permease small subunit
MSLAGLCRGLQRLEDALLALLVLLLVALAGAQIVLRDVFATGLSFAEPLMRGLVLWTGMLGALNAVREDRHIALDVLQRFLSPVAQRWARAITLGFTAVICAAMCWYSFALVRLDLGPRGAGAAALPAWWGEVILPFGFGLMALRFALRAMAPPAHPPVLLHDSAPPHP